jgi:hypothetical protein
MTEQWKREQMTEHYFTTAAYDKDFLAISFIHCGAKCIR